MRKHLPHKEHTIEVWTEGKTDWMHLKTAMHKLGLQLPIVFRENRESMGDAKLLKTCQAFSERENASPVVFIFDRDKSEIIKKVNDPINSYKSWGNEVYSFAIPVPSHRKGYSNICIELYYADETIQTKDSSNRRLYLTSEFHPVSGRHRLYKKLSIGNKAKIKNCTAIKETKIVDSEVYNEDDINIALTKADFADAIAQGMPPFDAFDFSSFEPIFNKLIEISRATRPANTVYLPDFDYYFKTLSTSSHEEQLCVLNNALFQTSLMLLQLFSIATIRVYEQQILVKDKRVRKNAKDIKRILREDFFNPAMKTTILLAKKCFHLIDNSAPESLLRMKDAFEDVFVLEALGQVLDDIERMYPPPKGKTRDFNKFARRDNLFGYFEKIAVYEKRLAKNLQTVSMPFLETGQISAETWYKGLVRLASLSERILSCPVAFRNVQYVDPISGEYSVENITYDGNSSLRELTPHLSDDLDDGSIEQSLLKLKDDFIVSLYPMLIVKDDALYTYRRTRSAGYEYYSIVQNRIHIERTKKKMVYSVFRAGGHQELFWTEVPPTKSPITGIRANIPQEGLEKFVGREQYQKTILKDILEVPNENGIIYGPGGIGKTALMQMISMRLFEDPKCAQHDIENIIWISAKKDFYDPHSGTIEPKEYNFTSFVDIVTAILEFYEFETLHEYNFEEKKDLVLEVFIENPTLLVLDNFETIKQNSPAEAEKIIDFFGKQVKRYLRKYPNNYKIIITSREQIPGGFQQVALKGLDPEESDQLMDKWLEWYSQSLDRKQRDQIYDTTKGIPIVIKHCLGQLFEFRKPISQVLRELSSYNSDIVQFSYKEILEQIESDEDKLRLRILLLLELLNHPLTIDQVGQLLHISTHEIERDISQLSRFQCIQTVYQSSVEKYQLNQEIRNLTRAISQKHRSLVEEMRKGMASSMELSFDASNEEITATKIFEEYIKQGSPAEAQTFAEEKLPYFKSDKLFNYHYASFLLKQRKHEKAISILESVLKQSDNDRKVLLLLINTNNELSEPKYEQMEEYAILLETWVRSDHDILLSVATFYSEWALWMKGLAPPDSPREKHLRINRYKDIAQKGLDIVNLVPRLRRNHKEYSIISKCKFCKWEYEKASSAIQSAIDLTSSEGDRAQYYQFKNAIEMGHQKYS
jgi:DNA replication protein DnaC/tetratricopeptide (TPR) repeat protein